MEMSSFAFINWDDVNQVSTGDWNAVPYFKTTTIFFQVMVMSVLLYGCTTWTPTKRLEKAKQELHKNTTSHIEQILEAISHKTAAVRPPTSHLKPSK